MSTAQSLLLIILIIIGIILIVLIIMQSGRVKNLGSSIVGNSDVQLFDRKKRGIDKLIHIVTIVLIIFFVSIAFIMIFV